MQEDIKHIDSLVTRFSERVFVTLLSKLDGNFFCDFLSSVYEICQNWPITTVPWHVYKG